MVQLHVTNATVRCLWCNRANYRRTTETACENLTLSGAANLFQKNSSSVPLQVTSIQARDAGFHPGMLTSDQSLSFNPGSNWNVPLENLGITEA